MLKVKISVSAKQTNYSRESAICTVFTHSFLYKKTHSFATFPRSFSDTSTTYSVCVNTRAVNKGRNPKHLLRLSMFDGSLMLWVNWPVVDTIHPQSTKFATGVKIKATGK